jgi:NADPH:quinone reductase-like Zn-dependent oxidoreductase
MAVQQWITPLKGIDSLSQTEAPMPAPGPSEVLVEIRAVSLNYRDVEGKSSAKHRPAGSILTETFKVTNGEYKHHKSAEQDATIVPCSDMCGVVTQVGSGVTKWAVGDRVLSTFLPDHQTGQVTEKELGRSLGLPQDGVLATHRVFPDHGLVKAPSFMSDEEAATLPIASVTAWMSINGMRPMGQNGGKDEYILLQGTGGVAIAGLQIAKAAGAKGRQWELLPLIGRKR